MATNQGFKSFVPFPDRLDSHYLLHWLRLRRGFLEGMGTGATFKEVSKAVVARIVIAVPPIALQRDFAERSTRLEALRSQKRVALELLAEQFASIQYRAFQGEL
jgi:type I restriction enzyme S subunit